MFGEEPTSDHNLRSMKSRPSSLDAFPKQPQPRTPAYKRIGDEIRLCIQSGQLRPGDPLDSERKVAKIHGVSLMTARHALTELARDGVVQRKPGAGTIVAHARVH